jgi:hypothetical protein
MNDVDMDGICLKESNQFLLLVGAGMAGTMFSKESTLNTEPVYSQP